MATAAGLPADTPLIIGAADGPLANLGVGATPAGVAAISLGTSGALRTIVDAPTADAQGRLFCYALTEDRWAIGGAVNNAGSVVRWAGQSFAGGFARPAAEGEDADERDAALLIEAASAAPGSDGLLCLPYLLGERAPWWRSGLRGAYIGLRREHGRPHLVRAAVEGVCQQLALVRDSFANEKYPVTEVRATGGSVASELWVGILAAALNLPVAVADTPEGTGMGACLLGLHALGELPDLDEAAALIAIEEPTRPDAGERRAVRPDAPADRTVRDGRRGHRRRTRQAGPRATPGYREGGDGPVTLTPPPVVGESGGRAVAEEPGANPGRSRHCDR